jgi:hypothetical protein
MFRVTAARLRTIRPALYKEVRPCAEARHHAKETEVFACTVQRIRRASALVPALALAALCLGAITVRAATVTATVDRPAITLGEAVTLSLSIQGANVAQPALPPIANVRVAGTSSAISFNSAVGVAQQTFTYQLVPSQVGDFVIPGIPIVAGGERHTTRPISVKVTRPGDAVTAPGAALPTAFVRLVTPKRQFYVGELSEVEVQVFFREGRMTQYPQLPADPGFTVGNWLKPLETRANVSNQLYNLVIFKQPITAVKAGALTLGPAGVSLFVADRTRRADFFFGRPEREMRMSSEKIEMQALPVPEENMPATFAGAIGRFSLAVTAAPTNVSAGDPITVRVQVQGQGALDSIQLPPQADWREFKTYPPTSRVENADLATRTGTKLFEQVVVPERAGIAKLPPLVFSFFDPDQRAFRTLTGPVIPLTVRPGSAPGSALPSLPGGTNGAPAGPATDLAHIKPYLGTAAPMALFITHPAFLLSQLIPPAAWLGLRLWRKRREHLANNPRRRRRQDVSRKVRQGLNDLHAQAAANNSDAFFATTWRLLQEQLGERLDLPASAITEAVVDERLRPGGAAPELCQSLHELFQNCNLARYAPAKSAQELSALIPKVESALAGLRAWPPANL